MLTVSSTPFAFFRRSVTLADQSPPAAFFGSMLGLSHFSFWHRSVRREIGVLYPTADAEDGINNRRRRSQRETHERGAEEQRALQEPDQALSSQHSHS